jgi:hypothetical protein
MSTMTMSPLGAFVGVARRIMSYVPYSQFLTTRPGPNFI